MWMQLFIIVWVLFFNPDPHVIDIPVVLILFFGSAMLVEGTLVRRRAKQLDYLIPSTMSQAPLTGREHFLFGIVGIVIFCISWYLYRMVIFPRLWPFYRQILRPLFWYLYRRIVHP
jgi:hypothetical protein